MNTNGKYSNDKNDSVEMDLAESRVTSFALGQMSDDESRSTRQQIGDDTDLQREANDIVRVGELVSQANQAELPEGKVGLEQLIKEELVLMGQKATTDSPVVLTTKKKSQRNPWRRRRLAIAATTLAIAGGGYFLTTSEPVREVANSNVERLEPVEQIAQRGSASGAGAVAEIFDDESLTLGLEVEDQPSGSVENMEGESETQETVEEVAVLEDMFDLDGEVLSKQGLADKQSSGQQNSGNGNSYGEHRKDVDQLGDQSQQGEAKLIRNGIQDALVQPKTIHEQEDSQPGNQDGVIAGEEIQDWIEKQDARKKYSIVDQDKSKEISGAHFGREVFGTEAQIGGINIPANLDIPLTQSSFGNGVPASRPNVSSVVLPRFQPTTSTNSVAVADGGTVLLGGIKVEGGELTNAKQSLGVVTRKPGFRAEIANLVQAESFDDLKLLSRRRKLDLLTAELDEMTQAKIKDTTNEGSIDHIRARLHQFKIGELHKQLEHVEGLSSYEKQLALIAELKFHESKLKDLKDYDERLARIKSEIERVQGEANATAIKRPAFYYSDFRDRDPSSNEQYELPPENKFQIPEGESARSTFSVDVDTASYANARRFITSRQLPPANAVRVEEFVNYFQYDYAAPTDEKPFAVNMEVAACPWNESNKLLRIGIKGKEIAQDDRPSSNLVFLIDVSGSMSNNNKLPLLQRSMLMLVDRLTENDKVTIVTYAGNAGLRLEPTSGDQKDKIRSVIQGLASGGSTHGSAGIRMAYDLASKNFINEGTNRVILATDGDLNVGVTADDDLVRLIKEKSDLGVFLSVLGFGTGNLKDAKLEKLADNGNGQYSYIDSIREARKVLVEEMAGSLVTIAKDVKVQLEFNPAEIASYRLIGYENRVLQNQDFDNDMVDAGDIGAGHTVTALYELVPVGAEGVEKKDELDAPLKYQRSVSEQTDDTKLVDEVTEEDKAGYVLTEAAQTGELMTFALRYKQPDESESTRIEYVVKDSDTPFDEASNDFRFATSVASFGMLLRHSRNAGSWRLGDVENAAANALGSDERGHRAEFIDLVRQTKGIVGN